MCAFVYIWPKHCRIHSQLRFSFSFFNYTAFSNRRLIFLHAPVTFFLLVQPPPPPRHLLPWLTRVYPAVLCDERFLVYSDTFLFTSVLSVAGLLSVVPPFYHPFRRWQFTLGLVVTSPLFVLISCPFLLPFFIWLTSRVSFRYREACITVERVASPYRQPVSLLGTFLSLERHT